MTLVFSLLAVSMCAGWYADCMVNGRAVRLAIAAGTGTVIAGLIAGYGFLQDDFLGDRDLHYLLGAAIIGILAAGAIGTIEAIGHAVDGVEDSDALPSPFRAGAIAVGIIGFLSSILAASISTTID
jgi:hypothetical protein